MRISSAQNRLKSVMLIGFVIVIAGWLYGKQDFFYRGFGTCTEAWNPRPIIGNDSESVTRCAKAAEARRDQIYFAGFVLFVLFTVGFLAISNKQDNKVKTQRLES